MLDTRALFRQFYPSGKRLLYVTGAGSDANDGLTLATAKRTIAGASGASSAGGAIAIAQPGDRIMVGTGTYPVASLYGVNGTACAWITIENIPSTSPVIDGSNDTSASGDGMDIQLSSFVGVYGLEVKALQTQSNSNASGIGIFRGSKRIAIWGCYVHDWPGGGVNCFYIAANTSYNPPLPAGGWDGVDVFFNTICRTSKYSVYNTSGISFYGAENLLGAVGIDGTYSYRAVGNYIYDVICTVPYTPGGFNQVTDGNGISPDSLAVPNSLNPTAPVYVKRGLIEGNLIVACGGRGVHIYNTINLDVVNNTLVGNLRSASTSTYIAGSTEVDLQLDTANATNGVLIADNVLAPMNTNKTIDLTAQAVTGNIVLGGTDTITSGNLDYRAMGLGWFSVTPTANVLITGASPVNFSPNVAVSRSRRVKALGYQVNGVGGRSPSLQSAGALETFYGTRPFAIVPATK